jgi:hypothetical protein
MRSIHRPPSITKALKPYHYPEDEDGNPVPTPTPRTQAKSSAADREVLGRVVALPTDILSETIR